MDTDATTPARFQRFSPIFPVRDLRRALAHYASLGFRVQPALAEVTDLTALTESIAAAARAALAGQR